MKIGNTLVGTHNSMSYIPIAKWWQKPLRLFVRCQKQTLLQQLSVGIRVLDIRVRFDEKNWRWVYCHGCVDFKLYVSPYSLCRIISDSSSNEMVIRLILERFDSPSEVRRFRELCKNLEHAFPYLSFIGGKAKPGWLSVYEFEDNKIYGDGEIYQPVSSMAEDARFYEKILPIAYHKRVGHKPGHNKITLYDFV